MAKKTTKTTKKKTTAKKTTARKAAGTRSAPAQKSAAPKSTPKKTTSKKTTAKKSAPDKATPTKTTTTKTTSKKATTTKKTPTSKKVTTNKKVAPKKKPATSNADNHTTDTPTTPKTPAGKQAQSKTTTKTNKKSTTKAPAKSAADAKSAKQDAAAKPKPSLQAGATRFRSPFAAEANVGRAAAQRLADLAGITPIRASEAHSTEKAKSYKRITKSPHTPAQLAEFRELLITKRRQLVGDVTSMEREALSGNGGSLSRLSQHMADQGSDVFDQTLNLDLAASQRRFLTEIDDAIDRIDNGTYGICELLGKPIGLERLRNTPWARFSIEAARQIEINPALARTAIGE